MEEKKKKTAKCCFCKKRFRLHDWQNDFERNHCSTCRSKLMMVIKTCFEPRKQAMIILRWGLEKPFETHTLEETGKEFGITRERVRQVEAKVLDLFKKYEIQNKIIIDSGQLV